MLAAVLFDTIGRRFGPRTAAALRAAFYLPQVLPVVVAGIVWGWILRPDGALNGLLDAVGLGALRHDWLGDPDSALPVVMAVMIWVQIGYPVVVFMAALQRVDPELYEAAEIDGAGWWQRFRAITLPQIRPETFVVALTCTIAALKVFGPIYALTRGGPENATNVPSYFAYFTFFKQAEGRLRLGDLHGADADHRRGGGAVHPGAEPGRTTGRGAVDGHHARPGPPHLTPGQHHPTSPAPSRRRPLARARCWSAPRRWPCWCRSRSCCSTRSSRPATTRPTAR